LLPAFRRHEVNTFRETRSYAPDEHRA
jgi:hypothetical protein